MFCISVEISSLPCQSVCCVPFHTIWFAFIAKCDILGNFTCSMQTEIGAYSACENQHNWEKLPKRFNISICINVRWLFILVVVVVDILDFRWTKFHCPIYWIARWLIWVCRRFGPWCHRAICNWMCTKFDSLNHTNTKLIENNWSEMSWLFEIQLTSWHRDIVQFIIFLIRCVCLFFSCLHENCVVPLMGIDLVDIMP